MLSSREIFTRRKDLYFFYTERELKTTQTVVCVYPIKKINAVVNI